MRPEKYPWDDWFDGDPHVLVRGEDFDCKTPSIAVAAHYAADRRGGRVSTCLPDGREGDTALIWYRQDDED